MSCVGDLDTQISLPIGVSQREIADEIGVSVSTVSRALSGNERVSRRTLDDVHRAIATLQNRRPLESTLLTRGLIGLTTSHLSDEARSSQLDLIASQVLGGAELAAHQLGHRIYTAHDSKLLLDPSNGDMLESMTGLLLTGGMVDPVVLESAIRTGLPVCIVGGHVPHLGIPSVSADFQHGAYLATRHLIELGHTWIALVNGPHATYTSHEKLAGYLAALTEANLPVALDLIAWFHWFSAFDSASGLSTMDQLFSLNPAPTAILFATDELAMGAISVLERRGISVPDQVSIVGFHDDPFATAVTPQLTTVRVDRTMWGDRAVKRVIAAERGETMQADRLLLPVELVVRDSTGPVSETRKGRHS
jgi:DNA-binding LacI/PurR family transcriptional regulator